MYYFLFTIIGFVCGSTLFAYWLPRLFKQIDIRELPDDHNPGVANAFLYGGFGTGCLALVFELGKGFVPVFVSRYFLDRSSLLFIPVFIAPVLGHAFPFFQKEKGGKCIAVSFGVLLGLFPEIRPAFFLICFYLLFSLVVVISPHSFRSVITFGLFALCVLFFVPVVSIRVGCILISVIVIYRHFLRYQGEHLSVRLF